MAGKTETTILDEAAVSEIEALRNRNTGPSFGYTHELCVAIDALCATVKQLRVELRRWQNGDVLPNGWTGLDAGDGFPNLYLYSRADIVEQAKQRLTELQSQLEQLRAENERLTKERDRAREDIRVLTNGRFIQS